MNFKSDIADTEMVVGNADRLVQVFVNLFRNALNAVEGGGHIWTTRPQVWQRWQALGLREGR